MSSLQYFNYEMPIVFNEVLFSQLIEFHLSSCAKGELGHCAHIGLWMYGSYFESFFFLWGSGVLPAVRLNGTSDSRSPLRENDMSLWPSGKFNFISEKVQTESSFAECFPVSSSSLNNKITPLSLSLSLSLSSPWAPWPRPFERRGSLRVPPVTR